jgi:glycosyltransferase involved in cell wall biosynthesis
MHAASCYNHISGMKNTPPSVFLVTDTYWPAKGGVEAWVHAYSAHLGKKFRVSVIAHAKSNSLGSMLSRTVLLKPFAPFQDDFGSPVSCLEPSLAGRLALLPFLLWSLPLVKHLWPKAVFDFLYMFYKIAFYSRLSKAVARADVVHCFSTGHLAACVTDVCRKRGIRLILSPPVHFGRWGDSPLLLSAYARADVVMCLSQTFKTEFERRTPTCGAPTVIAIPALTIEPAGPRRPDQAPTYPFILFLGRRERHKGLDLLLSAFETISGNSTLVIAGPPGPGTTHSSLPESCIDLGEVDEDEKQWLIENCDIFCVPSEDESFGIVYTEAMRCAKPVVALDVAPVNEIVDNGQTGILVPVGDQHALAAALKRLFTDEKFRKSMGQNGLRRYEEAFAPAVVLDQIMKVYESLLRERSDP